MDKKEIEIYVDKNNKVDCRDFLKMKIKYDNLLYCFYLHIFLFLFYPFFISS